MSHKHCFFQKMAITFDGNVNQLYAPCLDSMYAINMLQWQHYFPKDQILVVDGDRLIIDPVPELQKVETFLGLEHKITKDMFYFDEGKGFWCVIRDDKKSCISDDKGHKPPKVDPKTLKTLYKFFVPLNEMFYKLVGQRFNW